VFVLPRLKKKTEFPPPPPSPFQLLIPVSGSKAAGYLRTKATFQFGRWELDSVVLEFRGRPQTLTIVDNKESCVT